MRPLLCAALGMAMAVPLLTVPREAVAQTSAQPAPKARPAAPPRNRPAAPAAPSIPAADSEQIATAELAHYGEYLCEFGEIVHVLRKPDHHGWVDVKHRKTVATMKPILSSTGAVRLEDIKGRLLMLQIANKSMLMDTKIGQRLVDGCVHEKQREAASRPPTESLGIEPKKD